MLKTVIFLISFGLTVIGFTYIIAYLNLLSMGYSFNEYIMFILRRSECFIGIIGIVLINIMILIRRDNYDLYI